MGAPGELVGTEKSYAYARALAAASPRVRVFTIGHSEEGREILMIAVSDEAGHSRPGSHKAATAALADPRRTDQAAAEKLIRTARPIYYFNAALHSDETGSTEASRTGIPARGIRAADDSPHPRATGGADQSDFESRWPRQDGGLVLPVSQRQDGSCDAPRQSPPYWSKYTFVDINRDTHQQTLETTKAVHRMFHEWHPTVVHDLHEGMPLMMTWNGTGPYNPNIDPITYGEFLALSFREVESMTAIGMPGVWTWNFGEGFAHLFSIRRDESQQHWTRIRDFRQQQRGDSEALHLDLRNADAVVSTVACSERGNVVRARQS